MRFVVLRVCACAASTRRTPCSRSCAVAGTARGAGSRCRSGASCARCRVHLGRVRALAGVVVLDLVVVPDREERVGGMHVLQVLVLLVEAVLLPELGQALHVAVLVGAGLVLAGGRAVVVVVLVDVVAEAEDEVEVSSLARPAWALKKPAS